MARKRYRRHRKQNAYSAPDFKQQPNMDASAGTKNEIFENADVDDTSISTVIDAIDESNAEPETDFSETNVDDNETNAENVSLETDEIPVESSNEEETEIVSETPVSMKPIADEIERIIADEANDGNISFDTETVETEAKKDSEETEETIVMMPDFFRNRSKEMNMLNRETEKAAEQCKKEAETPDDSHLVVEEDGSVPEKRTLQQGIWIHDKRPDPAYVTGYVLLRSCTCSACGFHTTREQAVCPGCGAEMVDVNN